MHEILVPFWRNFLNITVIIKDTQLFFDKTIAKLTRLQN